MGKNLIKKAIATSAISLASLVVPLVFENGLYAEGGYKDKLYEIPKSNLEGFIPKDSAYFADVAEKKRIDSIMNLKPLTTYEVHKLVDREYWRNKPKYVDKDLIKAIIKRESRYDQFARSEVGAASLMQIMPKDYVKEYNKPASDTIELYIPEVNINAGIKLIKRIERFCEINHPHWKDLNHKDKLEVILGSYNTGIGNMRKRGFDYTKMSKETREYVPIVLSFYESYKSGKLK